MEKPKLSEKRTNSGKSFHKKENSLWRFAKFALIIKNGIDL